MERAHALGLMLATPKIRSKYFAAAAVVLLGIVAIGFGRTLFARALFDVPLLPWHYYVHASLLTAWFVFFVMQTALIAANSTELHRRLGILGAVTAVGVVASSLSMVLGLPARVKAGLSSGLAPIDENVARIIVWTDLAALAVFTIYVSVALLLRRRADVHKRLLLLASIAIVGPAAARVGLLLAALPPWVQTVTQSLFFVGLPLTVVIHDLVSARSVHRATIVGVLGLFASTFAAIAIALTPVGAAFVKGLE